MRVKDMHPLCCISLEGSPASAIGEESPEISLSRAGSLNRCSTLPRSDAAGGRGSDVSVAGPLYKWTNYGKGWRSRWFLLRGDGFISYSKILAPHSLNSLFSAVGEDVRLIGDVTSSRLNRTDSCGRRKCNKSSASFVVHLKASSFRESRSDDRRFYIFTATKTLHLRTNSKQERELWLEALASARNLFSQRPLNNNLLLSPRSFSISTERLKKRLAEGGVSDSLVKDCEQIMLSEFTEIQGQLKLLCEDRSNLLDTLRQFEAANIEGEASGINANIFRPTKHEYSGLERGKYSECSTTESSDDTEKQDIEEASDEEESCYYDTLDYLSESPGHCGSRKEISDRVGDSRNINGKADDVKNLSCHIERRKRLPDPVEKEKAVSLWSMIKDNVGKDLTRVCLPVYFNEPISSLQKCCEDLEYSYLLDRAYEYGKAGNSLMRIVNVAAFAVSAYASSEGRLCKPFNPLLGETYEADFPDRGFRFFSEKVSHHPTLIACHCEGRGWKFWADSNLKTKFWGQTIQLDPVGLLNLEFDDGERFQWSKVTTSICNLIIGKIYLDHHGTMHISGNRQYSCNLKFKGQSFLDRNPRQIHGFVEDNSGSRVGTVSGKWDESIFFSEGDGTNKSKDQNSSNDACLLWKRIMPTPNLTRYNLTSFAITLNELTPGLKENLPPTDSRLRPDQRHLENGEYDRANAEKLRLEKRQRMSRKMQEEGWKPRWFERQGDDGPYYYKGGYWEARDHRNWDGCPDIFGDYCKDINYMVEEL